MDKYKLRHIIEILKILEINANHGYTAVIKDSQRI